MFQGDFEDKWTETFPLGGGDVKKSKIDFYFPLMHMEVVTPRVCAHFTQLLDPPLT